jgi:arginase
MTTLSGRTIRIKGIPRISLLMEYCADNGKMMLMEAVELNPFLDKGNISAERTLAFILSAPGKSIF